MKTVKEMKIRISSEITNLSDRGEPVGEVEKTLECADGFVHFFDGEITVSYMISVDGADLNTDIVILPDEIRVRRKGAVSSHFVFREGEAHKSVYSVGAYSFDAEVTSQKQRYQTDTDCVRAYVYYKMRIGGADKQVKMKIIAE